MITNDSINLLDLDVFEQGMPHEWFTWLRTNAPVYHHPEPDGPGFWVISKYEDIADVSRRPDIFASDDLYGGPTGLVSAERERMFRAARGSKTLTHMDPPEHTAHRRLVEKRFRNRPVSALESKIRQLTGDLIDQNIARGTCDFVREVAAVVPTTIIMELMGMPETDRETLMAFASANFTADDPEIFADATAYQAARENMQAYAMEIANLRRRDPQDDVITTLVESTIDDQPLSDQTIALFIEQFVSAGHVTTLTAIAQGTNAFIQNPDQWQALVGDPSLSASATEEVLRWSTPNAYMRRGLREDMNFNGTKLSAGDSVTIWYISANRDEDVFEDPFRFDIRRTPNLHMAFGGGGNHYCIGARLARLETRVFLEEMAKRVTEIEQVGPAIQMRSHLFNALKRLPVRLKGPGCPAAHVT